MAAPQFIYHITGLSDWKVQESENSYTSVSLEDEGFIHCSRFEQLPATLHRFFKDRSDLLILKIDTKQLNVPLIYEAAEDGSGFFPHVFGVIRKKSITEVYSFPFNFLNQSSKKEDTQEDR